MATVNVFSSFSFLAAQDWDFDVTVEADSGGHTDQGNA